MENLVVEHIIKTYEPVDAVFALKDHAIQHGGSNVAHYMIDMCKRNPEIFKLGQKIKNDPELWAEYRRRRNT